MGGQSLGLVPDVQAGDPMKTLAVILLILAAYGLVDANDQRTEARIEAAR